MYKNGFSVQKVAKIETIMKIRQSTATQAASYRGNGYIKRVQKRVEHIILEIQFK